MEVLIPAIIFSTIAAIGVISHYFSKDSKIKRSLKNSPAKKISDFNHAEEGKIVGSARKINLTLNAPLSGRPCLFYQVIVEEKIKSGKSTSWRKIIHDENAVNFHVFDGTGEALIELENVEAFLVKDMNLKSNYWSPPSKKLADYLKQKGVKSKKILGQKTLRYHEGVLHLGETVAIKGTGFWELKPDPDEQRLIMRGTPEIELHLSDDKSTLA